MLPDHLVDELRYIEVYTARRFPNLRAGAYQSRLRGQGFDFDEHRLYQPGDDVRRIDWNVTARMDAPYLRETHAERELNVVVAVDVSPSMVFGTGRYSKKEVQLLLAACLAFSSLADQVNTGFLAFGTRVTAYIPPCRNRAQAWRFLQDLWDSAPEPGETSLLPVVRHLDDHFRQEGLVFIISDFLTDEDLGHARELSLLAARHDVVAVVVEDPAETSLPDSDAVVEFRDLETGERRRVCLDEGLRRRYADAMRRRRGELIESFYRVPMDYLFVGPDQRILEPLMKLFATRRRM